MKKNKRKHVRFFPYMETLEDRRLMAVVTADFDSVNYKYKITEVPDFDQRRAALDGELGLPNFGAMYCAPTSATNFMAYIANHGYAAVQPGPSDVWETGGPPFNSAIYDQATTAILQMGIGMKTDLIKGTTSSSNLIGGAQNWLDNAYSDAFVVSGYSRNDFAGEALAPMALSAISGDLVIPQIGWYSSPHTQWDSQVKKGTLTPDGETTLLNLYHSLGLNTEAFTRVGGHLVSMVGAEGDTVGIGSITINDPADDTSDLASQSAFTGSTYQVSNHTATYDGDQFRTLSGMDGYGGRIDGFYTIYAKYGLTATGSEITQESADPLTGSPGGRSQTYRTATGGNVLDLAISPQRGSSVYITADSDNIYQLDTITAKSTPLATVHNPKHLVYGGPAANLFVLGDNGITRIGTHGETARISLSQPVDNIAWDDAHQFLVGYDSNGRGLDFFNSDLRLIRHFNLPTGAVDGTGKVSLAENFTDGSLWIHRDGSTQVTCVQPNATATSAITHISLSGTQRPTGLSINDHGDLYVSDNGRMKVFDATGRQTNSPFNGLAAGSMLQISRSHKPTETAATTSAAFNNVLPDVAASDRALTFVERDSLIISGAGVGNRVSILDHGASVDVTIAGVTNTYTQPFSRIVVTGSQNRDDVSYEYDGNSRARIHQLIVNLGEGNDTFNGLVHWHTPPVEVSLATQRSSIPIAVNAGGGDDNVSIRTIVDPTERTIVDPNFHPVDFTADLGAGNDTFNADLAFPPDTAFPATPAYSPDLTRISVVGGSGDDALNLHAGTNSLISSLTSSVTAKNRLTFTLDGGDGNDMISSTLNHLTTLGQVNLNLLGGQGNDQIFQNYDKLFVKGGLNVTIDGGIGDDIISSTARSGSELALAPTTAGTPITVPLNPALLATSLISMQIAGGDGNDTFNSDITPCVLPQGHFDLLFRGGNGNDIFDLQLTMEQNVKSRDLDGSVHVSIAGNNGDDQLALYVQNLNTLLALELDGGTGRNSATGTNGIDFRGW